MILAVMQRAKVKSQQLRIALPMMSGMMCGDGAKYFAVRTVIPDVLYLDTSFGAEAREK